jgi:hypothetical protein
VQSLFSCVEKSRFDSLGGEEVQCKKRRRQNDTAF